LEGVVKVTVEGRPRYICIFINPIGGNGLGMSYYESILQPMLELNEIKHDVYKTGFEDFIDDFIEQLNPNEVEYTDFVIIGGDGLFNQLINAIARHQECDKLFQIPIGLIPAGSTNTVCCAISSNTPYQAAINILRGNYVKGDIFKITSDKSKATIYGTAATFGFLSDIVIESELLRSRYGSGRYFVTALKKIFRSWDQ
jgi:diacylglycerol kinase family enzyme